MNCRWTRECENTKQYLETLPVSLGSPITELSGSYNATYMSSVVGTKYKLNCPHGKIRNPKTDQFLTCLPNRKIALDPPDKRDCSGNRVMRGKMGHFVTLCLKSMI